jgi:hypothetical protein
VNSTGGGDIENPWVYLVKAIIEPCITCIWRAVLNIFYHANSLIIVLKRLLLRMGTLSKGVYLQGPKV